MKGRRYTLDAFPCQLDILKDNAFNSCVMKSAQLAASEIFSLARSFYALDVLKVNWAIMFPNQGAMRDFFRTRLKGAVVANKYLRRNVTAENESNIDAFGRTLFNRYTTTEAAIATFDASGVTVDELDLHNKETLFGAKTSRTQGSMSETWWYEISTPTYPKAGIHQAFLDGDQRKWLIRCPGCGRDNDLTSKFGPYDATELPKFFTEFLSEGNFPRWEDYFVPCSHCGRRIDPVAPIDPVKPSLGGGRWVAEMPQRDEHSWWLQIWQRRYEGGTPDVLRRVRRSLLRADGALLMKRWWNFTVGVPYVPREGKLTQEDLDRASTSEYSHLWTRDLLCRNVYRIHGEDWDWMGVDVRDQQYHIVGIKRLTKTRKIVCGVGWVGLPSEVKLLHEAVGEPFFMQDALPDMAQTRALVRSIGRRARRAKFGKNIVALWQQSADEDMLMVNRPKAMEEVKAEIESMALIVPKEAWDVGAGIFQTRGETRTEETLADHFKAPTMVKEFNENSANEVYDFPKDAMGGIDPHYFMAAALAVVGSRIAKAPSHALTVPR